MSKNRLAIRSLAVGREDFSQLTKTERTKRRLRSMRDHRGFDLISAVLPFGRLWYGGPPGVMVNLALFVLMIVGFALSLWPEKKTRPIDEAASSGASVFKMIAPPPAVAYLFFVRRLELSWITQQP